MVRVISGVCKQGSDGAYDSNDVSNDACHLLDERSYVLHSGSMECTVFLESVHEYLPLGLRQNALEAHLLRDVNESRCVIDLIWCDY